MHLPAKMASLLRQLRLNSAFVRALALTFLLVFGLGLFSSAQSATAFQLASEGNEYSLDFASNTSTLVKTANNAGPIPSQYSNFTVEAWIHPDADTNGWQTIMVQNQTSVATGLSGRFYLGYPGGRALHIGISGQAKNTTHIVELNKWTHIAMSYEHIGNPGSPTSVRTVLYVNGSPVDTTTTWTPVQFEFTNGFAVGTATDGGYEFDGKIDQVKIWNSVLTQSDIQKSMYAYNSEGITSSTLRAHYDFNDGVNSSIIADRTGNGHDLGLTITGSSFKNDLIAEYDSTSFDSTLTTIKDQVIQLTKIQGSRVNGTDTTPYVAKTTSSPPHLSQPSTDKELLITTTSLKDAFGSSNSISLFAWTRPTSSNHTLFEELGYGNFSSPGNWYTTMVEMIDGRYAFRVYNCISSTAASTTSLNQWHHVGITYDGTTMRGYVDGVEVVNRACSRSKPTAEIHYGIGSNRGTDLNANGQYKGGLDVSSFQIYKDAIPAYMVSLLSKVSIVNFSNNWDSPPPTNFTQTIRNGTGTALLSNTFTRAGYAFDGWDSISGNGGGARWSNGETVTLYGDLTLYARWIQLSAALNPTFGTPTPTADGYTVQINNYSADYNWAGTATASGTVSISGTGLVTVSGVAANTSSTATITTTRSLYNNGSATVSGTSLAACSPSSATNAGYTILTFSSTTRCNWTVPAGVSSGDVLVVGGGGGGATVMTSFANTAGGGGGGGGVFYGAAVSLPSTVVVGVGTGGAGGVYTNNPGQDDAQRVGRGGSQGATTTFGTISAGGGGGGGCDVTILAQGDACTTGTSQGRSGTAAGSGGGASYYYNAFNPGGPGVASNATFNGVTINSQVGFTGGYYNQGGTSIDSAAGPGGGARGDGDFDSPGIGFSSSITGTTVEYGKGGGAYGVPSWSFASTATGYGTGGHGQRGSLANGGAGAQGVVIVRYANTYTVTYNYNSADGGTRPVSSTFTTGGTAITLPTPTKTGFTLAGWYESSTFTGSALGSTYTTTSNVTINAKWASNNANLSGLTISQGTLSPTFSSGTTAYTASVANSVTTMTVTPTRSDSGASITVNGTSVTSGTASGSINLSIGSNTINVVVTAADGSTSKTYAVTVTRANNAALTPTFGTPVTTADGYTVEVSNYLTGTNKTDFTWNASASTGTASLNTSTGVVTITGLAASTSSTLTVTTTRSLYNDGSATVSSTSMSECTKTTDTTVSPGYTVLKFTNVATCRWTVVNGITSINYLAVAGGGGGAGGTASDHGGGGGGAGGVRTGTLDLTSISAISLTVGAGGTAGSGGQWGTRGGNGSNSAIANVTATGGGGGGIYTAAGIAGGSGGGAGAGNFSTSFGAGSAGQGNAGGTVTRLTTSGRHGGGGGGAGGVGGNTTDNGSNTTAAGAGGIGVQYTHMGTAWFAGGGGGGGTTNNGGSGVGGSGYSGSTAATAGAANTGSGGGGGVGTGGSGASAGAAGGSGIVVIAYANTYTVTYNYNQATGGNSDVSASYTSGTTAITLPVPTRTNYTFAGWYVASNFSGSAIGLTYAPTVSGNIYAKWTANDYVITYQYNSADGGTRPTTSNFTLGGSAITLPTPTRTGYTFANWFADSTFTTEIGAGGASFSPSGSTLTQTIYAKWSAVNYTVTYATTNSTGGSAPTDSGNYNIGGTVVIKGNTGNLARTGYSFSGWTAASDGSGALLNSGGTFTVASSNMTFYPKWSANTYTITYNKNGASGSPANTSHTYTTGGSAVTLSAVGTMAKTGFDFSGWSTSPTGSVIAGTYTTAQDITLYAIWTIKSINITFSKGIAANATVNNFPSNTSLDYGSTLTLAGNVTSTVVINSVAYAFVGWSYSGNIYRGGDTYLIGNDAPTFTAEWVKIFAVRYAMNGGTAAASSSEVDAECTYVDGSDLRCTDGQVITINAAPTRSGYTFAGWVNQGNQAVTAAATTTITSSNYLFYATWTPVDYAVTYALAGGGSALPSGFTKRIGQTFTTETSPTRTGYNFAGWSDGSSVYGAGTTYYMGASAVTLTATWTPKTYTVTYDWNGGTGSSTSNDSYTVGNSGITLPLVGNHVKDGFEFSGWSTTSNGDLISGAYVPTADTTLYAIWGTGSYTVTYDARGGSVSTSSASVRNGSSLTLPTPTRTSYVFDGWHTATTGGSRIGNAGASHQPTQSRTLYARWIQSSLYGLDSNTLTRFGSATARTNANATFTGSNADSSVSVTVPDGALPDGTTVNFDLVGNYSRAQSLLNGNNNYIISMVVSWIAPDETVPNTNAGKAISVTITNSSIKAGASVYALVAGSATFLGTATQDGTVTVSLTSDPEVVVVTTKPGSPTSVTASAGGTQQSVISWSAPSSNGGSTITGYTATANSGATCTTTSTSCTISGLSDGTTYTFTVTATNALGTSEPSTSASARTADAVVSGGGGGSSSGGGSNPPIEVQPSAPIVPVKSNITTISPITVVGETAVQVPSVEVTIPSSDSTTKPVELKLDAASQAFIAQVKIVKEKLVLTPVNGFSGKRNVSVTIIENDIERIVQIPLTVLPEPVKTPVYRPSTISKSVITWGASENAVNYTVLLEGKRVCSTSTLSCSISKLLGPNSKLEVVANGGDRTISERQVASFAQGSAIGVTRIVSATITKAALTSVDTRSLDKVASLIKNQGFTTVVISQISTTKKTEKLALARIELIKKYLMNNSGSAAIKFEVVPPKSRTYFNNISVKG